MANCNEKGWLEPRRCCLEELPRASQQQQQPQPQESRIGATATRSQRICSRFSSVSLSVVVAKAQPQLATLLTPSRGITVRRVPSATSS